LFSPRQRGGSETKSVEVLTKDRFRYGVLSKDQSR